MEKVYYLKPYNGIGELRFSGVLTLDKNYPTADIESYFGYFHPDSNDLKQCVECYKTVVKETTGMAVNGVKVIELPIKGFQRFYSIGCYDGIVSVDCCYVIKDNKIVYAWKQEDGKITYNDFIHKIWEYEEMKEGEETELVAN